MRLLRRKKGKHAATPTEAPEASRVAAMLAIHVHEPEVLLTDMPSGDRLLEIAQAALSRHGGSQRLAMGAHVRGMVTAAGTSMATQEERARSDAPGLMADYLRERGLGVADHEIEVWSESLNPKVRVVWVAAARV